MKKTTINITLVLYGCPPKNFLKFFPSPSPENTHPYQHPYQFYLSQTLKAVKYWQKLGVKRANMDLPKQNPPPPAPRYCLTTDIYVARPRFRCFGTYFKEN